MVEQDLNKICNIVLFWCKAKSPSFVTVVTIRVKPVLSDNPLGMAYWLLNTGWLFTTGVPNVRVIIENEGRSKGEISIPQQIDHYFFYLFLEQ